MHTNDFVKCVVEVTFKKGASSPLIQKNKQKPHAEKTKTNNPDRRQGYRGL